MNIIGAQPVYFGECSEENKKMIVAENLFKTYKTRKKSVDALKGVSFTADAGGIYGLIGPNGAGKTTALRTLATLLRPDRGSVLVNGLDTIKEARKVRDSLGFLTSDMKLSGNLSPRELLRFFGLLNHMAEETITERINVLAEYLDMGEFLDRAVAKLSTGMKQKASIAVSIVHDPGVIVFDEPTAGLDILASKIVNDFLRDSRRQGKTVVISTHVLQEADRLCDTVGILVKGELLENGEREKILQKHGASSLDEVFFGLYSGNGSDEK